MKANKFRIELNEKRKQLCSIRQVLALIYMDDKEKVDKINDVFVKAINGLGNVENQILKMQEYPTKKAKYTERSAITRAMYIPPSKKEETLIAEIVQKVTAIYEDVEAFSLERSYLHIIDEKDNFKLDLTKGYFKTVKNCTESVYNLLSLLEDFFESFHKEEEVETEESDSETPETEEETPEENTPEGSEEPAEEPVEETPETPAEGSEEEE